MDKPAMDKPVTTETVIKSWQELEQKVESQNKEISSLLQSMRQEREERRQKGEQREQRLLSAVLQIESQLWLEKQRRLLKAIANHAPFSARKDLTISALLSLALESLPECPQTTKQEWLKDAVDSCLRGIQRTVLKEVAQPDPIEVPRRLPVPIALAGGRYPGPSDASDNGCVYGGVTLRRDPLRWHWHFTYYLLLENSGFTHWLPPDVECLPAKAEP
jgi:hypothetical protein